MNPYPEGANLKAVQLQAIIVGKQVREVILEYFLLVSYVPYFPRTTLIVTCHTLSKPNK